MKPQLDSVLHAALRLTALASLLGLYGAIELRYVAQSTAAGITARGVLQRAASRSGADRVQLLDETSGLPTLLTGEPTLASLVGARVEVTGRLRTGGGQRRMHVEQIRLLR